METPSVKPYNRENTPKVVYFKEQNKLYKAELENIIPWLKKLPKTMILYIPKEYPDVIEDWHEQAIFLKCKNNKQIDSLSITVYGNILYPYIITNTNCKGLHFAADTVQHN